MRFVRHTATLVYYDGPQVFEARDPIGGVYIAARASKQDESERFLVAGVMPEQLRKFRMGLLDLRTLLIERPVEEWFLGYPTGNDEDVLDLELQDGLVSRSQFLPHPGFFLRHLAQENGVLAESAARNNLVMEVSVNPPETTNGTRIHATSLSLLLQNVQGLVKHAYRKAVKPVANTVRDGIEDIDNAHLLDVVAMAPGSYKLVLEASTSGGMFGQSEMSRALLILDEMFAQTAHPDDAVEIVRKYKGHLAGAYLRLLNFMIKIDSGFSYAWAEPEFSSAHSFSLSKANAIPIVDILSREASLQQESVSLTGVLMKADLRSGAWRIETDHGEVSGTTKQGGPSLAGMELESMRYRFDCLEEIRELDNGTERRKLYLVNHEAIGRA